jgi:hypothetical protein
VRDFFSFSDLFFVSKIIYPRIHLSHPVYTTQDYLRFEQGFDDDSRLHTRLRYQVSAHAQEYNALPKS